MDLELQTASDITEEIVDMTVEILSGWYDTGPIDWQDVWDRLEKATTEDGRGIDCGSDLGSDALKSLQRRALKAHRDG